MFPRVRDFLLASALLLAVPSLSWARNPTLPTEPDSLAEKPKSDRLYSRIACNPGQRQTDQDVNNVRARLTTGGDVWWNGDEGLYVVPKVEAGEREISSIFAGAVWLGGLDPAGNLKLAAQTYGRGQGAFDFYPGPLNPETGEVTESECTQWDKFFTVTAAEIREHRRLYAAALNGDLEYTEDMIPPGVKGWPATGNIFFRDVHGFDLPNTNQGLAGFYDYCDDEGNCNINGLYDPLEGDFPIVEIRGCTDFYAQDLDTRDAPQFPDQMIFWIYNDNGNTHEQSGANIPLEMEVQVQAFGYSTNDALNNMTFQRYKLINRGKDLLRNTFFGIWVDGDLGCFSDDYIGCDTSRSLAYYYNADAVDGNNGTTCGATNTYGTEVPMMGIDYFRGPNEFVNVFDEEEGDSVQVARELGMSSFIYYNNPSFNGPFPPATTDPSNGFPEEYYNYLQGNWKDGSPYTVGGTGYQSGGQETTYAFPSTPTEEGADVWSMCSEQLGEGDRRTIQSSGPFDLLPGAVNELIVGVPWVPDEPSYPCPALDRLLEADDLAQNLFDNCFDITDGPDAPDIDVIELDRELTLVLTNDTIVSNNKFLRYAEIDLLAPDGVEDSIYRFEGYKVYQLADANVSVDDLDDPTQARLIYQADVKNGVGELYNWNPIPNPFDQGQPVYEPIAQVGAANPDQGITSVIRLDEDQFATNDRRLVNHKPYYFTSVAYAYNNYLDFDAQLGVGQRLPYLEGRNNVRTYVAVPHPVTDVVLADSTAEVSIRRLDGVGTGPFFLDLAEGERERLLEEGGDRPVYRTGRAPVSARTFNPFITEDGTYRIEFTDATPGDQTLDDDGTWRITDPAGQSLLSGLSFDELNERVIASLGVSITLGQVGEPGSQASPSNGCIGYEVEVPDGGVNWLFPIQNKTSIPLPGGEELFNFVRSEQIEGDPASARDPQQGLTECFDGEWVPLGLTAYSNPQASYGFITPAYQSARTERFYDRSVTLDKLNNVDIVFTDDKSKWSRSVVVETASPSFTAAEGISTEGGTQAFALRQAPSVSRDDGDGDGLPDPDGDGVGMGWFPGYALDVETGQRLNIFFGENSAIRYDDDPQNPYNGLLDVALTGRDMMFNPTGDAVRNVTPNQNPALFFAIAGGHHFIYVTREPYDECAKIREALTPKDNGTIDILGALETVTYTAIPLSSEPMKPYADGLIPAETIVKLRVDRPYAVAQEFDSEDRSGDAPTGENNGYPAYEFTLNGVTPREIEGARGDSILSYVNVVPNPYYGYSEYEISEFSNLIRITNLPAVATVTIYTLDGKFVRQYKRAEELPGVDVNPDDPRTNSRAIASRRVYPDLDWDMKNEQGIPVASGVYLIQVDAGELGSRTLKSFLLQREFDPAGL